MSELEFFKTRKESRGEVSMARKTSFCSGEVK